MTARKIGLSSTALMLIACLAMTIDHIGAIIILELRALPIWENVSIFSIYYAMRGIGRIAFPMYAFLLAEGINYTKNAKAFALRLFIFALISELPFDYSIFGDFTFSSQNVFLTLFLGFVAVSFYKQTQQKNIGAIAVIFAGFIAQMLNTDYGAVGVYAIFLYYFFRTKPLGALWATAILTLMLCMVYGFDMVGACYLLSIPFMLLYNGKRGGEWMPVSIRRWFGYIYYPLHITVLGLIVTFLL